MTVKNPVPDSEKAKEKEWPQIVVILISTLAGLNNSLMFSWVSPFLVKITQDKENYDITEEEASHFNTIQPIAIMIACPIFSILSDKIGRKRTLLLIVIPQISYWLCTGFARSIYVFYIARMCSGISEGCFFVALPIYIGEIANPSVRGTWGNAISNMIFAGQFLINVLGSYFGVRTTCFICLPLPILFFILFIHMPESPYYYIMKGQEENAKKSLKFLKRLDNVDAIYASLKKDVDRQLSESSTWLDLIKINSNRKAVRAGLFLRFSQHMSCFIVFSTYTQFIFQKAGGNVSREHSAMLFQGLCFGLNLVVLFLIVKRFGRRICFMTSLFSSGIVLYMMAAYFYIDQFVNLDLSDFKWAPIVLSILYLFFVSFGLAVIPTLMLSELFSASIKSKAMIVLMVAYGLGSFFANYLFYNLGNIAGFYAPFLLFAICNTTSTMIAYFVVPETRGKSLEEIQQLLKSNDITR